MPSTPFWAILPFLVYLLGIALVPIFFGHFWESNRNKLIVALIVSSPVFVYLLVSTPNGGNLLGHTACDYLSFMALLAALFTISGGICLHGERRFLERCSSTSSVKARVLEVTGRPAETILTELKHHDLVLLGRDANFRFATEDTDTRTWDVVLHQASKPVIVVPDGERSLTGAAVLAYDGSLAATRALKIFAESGLAQGRSLHVVTVNGSGAIAWELATQAVDTLKELGFEGKVHNIVSVLPIADALLETATQIGADLIVMGSFAHSRLRNFFRGSVTQQLVEKTTIPLFLTH